MLIALGLSVCRPTSGALIAEVFSQAYRGVANGDIYCALYYNLRTWGSQTFKWWSSSSINNIRIIILFPGVFSWGVYYGYGLAFVFGIYITKVTHLCLKTQNSALCQFLCSRLLLYLRLLHFLVITIWHYNYKYINIETYKYMNISGWYSGLWVAGPVHSSGYSWNRPGHSSCNHSQSGPVKIIICDNDYDCDDFDAGVHKQISGPKIGSGEQGGGREEIESQWNQVMTRYLPFQCDEPIWCYISCRNTLLL